MSTRERPRRSQIAPALPSRCALTHHRGRRIPRWFHGLLDRRVAEDLLLKSPAKPKEGLFLVRQSSNRGGCFVISVCTGYQVNHYLIETLESMFYVKRESGGERGRDIQACDLVNLVECYKRIPLDISGLTLHQPLHRMTPLAFTTSLSPTPSSKDNHNYIPLYVDHRHYIGKEDFCASDLETTSFNEGEPVTILLKETKKWWFGYNSKGDLGYVPSGLLSPSYDMEPREGPFSDSIQGEEEEEERVEISEFAKTDDDEMGLTMQNDRNAVGNLSLDVNSNMVKSGFQLTQKCNETVQRTDVDESRELQRVPDAAVVVTSSTKETKCANEIYVSSDYISACVQSHEQKLVNELLCAQRGISELSDDQGDREWTFEEMDVALLEEQIVPDMDMDTSFPPQGHLSEAFEEDLWAEHNQSWNLPIANSRMRDSSENGMSHESELESQESLETDAPGSEAYDPVETYLRLCDCWSRPVSSN